MSYGTPLDTPNTSKTPPHDNYKFQLRQLQISTMRTHKLPGVICNIVVKADLGRSASRSTPWYWHLLVKTGNWQIFQQIYPQMHYGIYIMGCIWQSFWNLWEKVGISFYFWIIRLVNSQLALYNHVICNPLDTPNTPKTPPHDNYKCQLWGLIFARNNM